MNIKLPKSAKIAKNNEIKIKGLAGWDIANCIAKENNISIKDLTTNFTIHIYDKSLTIDEILS